MECDVVLGEFDAEAIFFLFGWNCTLIYGYYFIHWFLTDKLFSLAEPQKEENPQSQSSRVLEWMIEVPVAQSKILICRVFAGPFLFLSCFANVGTKGDVGNIWVTIAQVFKWILPYELTDNYKYLLRVSFLVMNCYNTGKQSAGSPCKSGCCSCPIISPPRHLFSVLLEDVSWFSSLVESVSLLNFFLYQLGKKQRVMHTSSICSNEVIT